MRARTEIYEKDGNLIVNIISKHPFDGSYLCGDSYENVFIIDGASDKMTTIYSIVIIPDADGWEIFQRVGKDLKQEGFVDGSSILEFELEIYMTKAIGIHYTNQEVLNRLASDLMGLHEANFGIDADKEELQQIIEVNVIIRSIIEQLNK